MKQYLIPISIIVLAVILLHGRSINYGLLLDDFNHRAELRDSDCSLKSLIEASHLGGPDHRVLMWWQEDADLFFFRPLSFFLMKLEYTLCGWRTPVMHACSLAWTVLAAVLVMLLTQAVLNHRGFSTLAGVCFAIHPANYLTTGWIACQNEQMMTVFILAGLFFYGKYSGWFLGSVKGGPLILIATIICFLAALGCRENSILFPIFLLIGDFLARPQRTKGRWTVYLIFAGILAAYLIVRHLILGPLSMPDSPYAYPMDKPGFWRFIIDKFIYYVLGVFAYFPIIGFGGLTELRCHPFGFYGTFTVGAIIWLAAALVVPGSGHPLFMDFVGPSAPRSVLPIFASSHHVYLATAGMVIASVTAACWIVDRARKRVRESFNRGFIKIIPAGIFTFVVLHMILFSLANYVYHTGLAGFHAASQLPVKDVIQYAGPFKPDDKLFFVNLPMLGFNCMPGIKEATGVSALTGYVLTFAPSMIAMEYTTKVERIGPRQLRVRFEDPGYFSGMARQVLLEASGREEMFRVGEIGTAPDFEVQVVRADESAVYELVFTFNEPLDHPSYHFFFASPKFGAYPLRFDNKKNTRRIPNNMEERK